ncbi:hypothetical protein AB0469_05425 [Streptomyces sp. NPDC093801]|uniref:hypothetical protein n=1 Tax=Streptomyces sp. NPDC093801 TaxID=3155203 RepID=UPI00344FA307
MAYASYERYRPQARRSPGASHGGGLSPTLVTSWTHAPTEAWEPCLAATYQGVCGTDFHAIRVPAGPAAAAHARLGAEGPVLASAYSGVWYWLLRTTAIDPASWSVAGTRVMPAGRFISIPPTATRTGPDVHWIVPPGEGSTSPVALARALAGQAATAATTRARRSRSRAA